MAKVTLFNPGDRVRLRVEEWGKAHRGDVGMVRGQADSLSVYQYEVVFDRMPDNAHFLNAEHIEPESPSGNSQS